MLAYVDIVLWYFHVLGHVGYHMLASSNANMQCYMNFSRLLCYISKYNIMTSDKVGYYHSTFFCKVKTFPLREDI